MNNPEAWLRRQLAEHDPLRLDEAAGFRPPPHQASKYRSIRMIPIFTFIADDGENIH
jgi:hypothetical protein